MPTLCVRCDKVVEWFEPLQSPSRAVVFATSGNYGSRVFDEIHGDMLVGIICDDCVEAADLRVQTKRTPQVVWEDQGTYTEWDADQRARMKEVR